MSNLSEIVMARIIGSIVGKVESPMAYGPSLVPTPPDLKSESTPQVSECLMTPAPQIQPTDSPLDAIFNYVYLHPKCPYKLPVLVVETLAWIASPTDFALIKERLTHRMALMFAEAVPERLVDLRNIRVQVSFTERLKRSEEKMAQMRAQKQAQTTVEDGTN
jgi:hypothetical protein